MIQFWIDLNKTKQDHWRYYVADDKGPDEFVLKYFDTIEDALKYIQANFEPLKHYAEIRVSYRKTFINEDSGLEYRKTGNIPVQWVPKPLTSIPEEHL